MVWSAIVLLPFATLAGTIAEARPYALVVVGLFLLLAAIDALWLPSRLSPLSAELPAVTRVSMERAATLSIRLQNQLRRQAAVTVTLELPRELQSEHDRLSVGLPVDSEWSEVAWKFQPLARGRFVIPSIRIEAISPLRFWAGWRSFASAAEVRVYPNLKSERRSLAALFLNRGAVGLHAQRMVGKGREFEKLRDYIAGDSYDEVHWKATAKRGRPVTKVYQIERTQEIYVIIDASRLSARSVPDRAATNPLTVGRTIAPAARSTMDQFISAALVLGLAAENQGDLFGLLTFGEKIETFIRARNGTSHYHACRDALYTLNARDVSPDFDELSSFIRLRLRRRALLFFLTSLDDPVAAESFVRNMDLLCRQHLILVNMLQPPGARPLFTGESNSTAELYESLGGHMRWQRLRELDKVLQRRGVRFNLIESGHLAVDLVSQYINVKQRQLI